MTPGPIAQSLRGFRVAITLGRSTSTRPCDSGLSDFATHVEADPASKPVSVHGSTDVASIKTSVVRGQLHTDRGLTKVVRPRFGYAVTGCFSEAAGKGTGVPPAPTGSLGNKSEGTGVRCQ